MDQCKPIQRQEKVAVVVVLKKNIDAVVVHSEKTAIDCIELRGVALRWFVRRGAEKTQYMRSQQAG